MRALSSGFLVRATLCAHVDSSFYVIAPFIYYFQDMESYVFFSSSCWFMVVRSFNSFGKQFLSFHCRPSLCLIRLYFKFTLLIVLITRKEVGVDSESRDWKGGMFSFIRQKHFNYFESMREQSERVTEWVTEATYSSGDRRIHDFLEL